jgi:hypothetical protein
MTDQSKTVFFKKAAKAGYMKFLVWESIDCVPSMHDLYLYGSLSKGGIKGYSILDESIGENTDYDFAVQHSAQLQSELCLSTFWKEKQELNYQDSMTERVYEAVFEGEKVQLSLRKDLHIFKTVWESIEPTFYWKYLNKRSPFCMPPEDIVNYLDQMNYLLQGVYGTPFLGSKNKSVKHPAAFHAAVEINNLPAEGLF